MVEPTIKKEDLLTIIEADEHEELASFLTISQASGALPPTP